MLASVFFGVPFNKKPYVSLLGGTFFVALESGCLAYESGFIIIELMDTDLRLLCFKYRKARVIHRYNNSQVRCAVSRYGFELKRRHIYV